jgi:hypothetical protein
MTLSTSAAFHTEAELAHRKGKKARDLRREISPSLLEDHCVYVIELRADIWERSDFAKRNPSAQKDYPCLYVGRTSKTPEQRLEIHRAGGQHSASKVEEYCVGLRPEFYERLNPMTKDDAIREERELAECLMREGYAVWWN